jgi:superfamily II DNA or RNA helicase
VFDLRPYQREAVDAVFDSWNTPNKLTGDVNKSVGIILPTGAGKTEIFIEIVRRYVETEKHKKVLILSHKDILVTQTKERIEKRIGVSAGIFQGFKQPRETDQIILSTMQTSCNREKMDFLKQEMQRRSMMNPYLKNEFEVGLIIIDECHRMGCASYESILDYFQGCRVLGCTATPFRGTQVMTNLLDDIAYTISINDLIAMKYLVPPKIIYMESGYAEGFGEDEIMARCLKVYKDKEEGNCAIIYLKTIEEARYTRNVFVNQGVPAECIDASTDKDFREQCFQRFKSGELKVLTTVNVLTEGFDAPNTSAIIIPYPTKSPVTYLQRIGRGLRTQDGGCLVPDHWKQECRIYYGGEQHPTISRQKFERLQEQAIMAGSRSYRTVEEEFDYMKLMKMNGTVMFTWNETVVKAINKFKSMKMTPISSMLNERKFPEKFMDKLDDFIEGAKEKPRFPLRGDATEAQLNILKKKGFGGLDGLSKMQASRLISGIAKVENWKPKDDEEWIIPSGIHKGKKVWEAPIMYWIHLQKKSANSALAAFYRSYQGRNKKEKQEGTHVFGKL